MPYVERGAFDSSRDVALEVNPLDVVSRDRCATAAGVVMARTFANELIHVIVNAGRDEFRRVYAPTARLHAFKQEDVDHIFNILKRTAELNPIGSTHVERMPL